MLGNGAIFCVIFTLLFTLFVNSLHKSIQYMLSLIVYFTDHVLLFVNLGKIEYVTQQANSNTKLELYQCPEGYWRPVYG